LQKYIRPDAVVAQLAKDNTDVRIGGSLKKEKAHCL
jgi:hypothetical protein